MISEPGVTRSEMRHRLWLLLTATAVAAALLVGGVWLWGRPRSHVHPPTAQTSPVDVVRAYEKARRDRDFAGAASLMVDQPADEPADEHWWSWHTSWFEITHLGSVTIDDVHHPKQTYGPADAWEQTAEVQTESTLHDFSGANSDTEPDAPWNFILVRHSSSEPWRIISQGQG